MGSGPKSETEGSEAEAATSEGVWWGGMRGGGGGTGGGGGRRERRTRLYVI